MADLPDEPDPAAAWAELVGSLAAAGERLDTATAELDAAERVDAFRSLVRALNNHLGRFEVDRDRPELVAFNGWREKLFMDNPDFRYWVADVRDDGEYRVTGSIGDAAYMSVTAYTTTGTLDAAASSRIDSDAIAIGPDGTFEVTVCRERPAGPGDWLALPEGAGALWVRQFHDDVDTDSLGWCRIEPIADPGPTPAPDGARFARRVRRLGRAVELTPAVWTAATTEDLAQPNTVRRWTEMASGAAFTEPDIAYLRGSWELGPDEALLIEGEAVPCRYWNLLLYSRFLNSLDHRSRPVSLTGARARVRDGRYRVALSPRRPDHDVDWLDTEGRRSGLFVFRFLQPEREPELPTVTTIHLDRADPVL